VSVFEIPRPNASQCLTLMQKSTDFLESVAHTSFTIQQIPWTNYMRVSKEITF
jgi:hypothetical protein